MTQPGTPPQRPRPAPKNQGVSRTLALVVAALALVGGIILGYSVRGEPAPAGLITEERDVPVVTVTVEQP